MENNTMQVCKWSLPIKRWGVLLFLLGNMLVTYGQYMYGTTGLLQMPSADMQRDKTFMIGGSVLAPQIIPSKEWWGNYYTFNYYINITVFPWLEIGYDCVLVKAKPGIYHWVPSTYGKFVNQDRSFHGRLRSQREPDGGTSRKHGGQRGGCSRRKRSRTCRQIAEIINVQS